MATYVHILISNIVVFHCRFKNANLLSQAGDPHPNKCFVCDLANELLLDCRQCSRSYHAKCLDPPMEHSLAPDSWPCPACALLNGAGATHSYLLDLPYERQDTRRMTRIDGAGGIRHSTHEMDKEPNHSEHVQFRNEGILQSHPAESGRPKFRECSRSNDDTSLINRSDSNLHSIVPPDASGSDDLFTNRRTGTIDLTTIEKPSTSADTSRKLSPRFL